MRPAETNEYDNLDTTDQEYPSLTLTITLTITHPNHQQPKPNNNLPQLLPNHPRQQPSTAARRTTNNIQSPHPRNKPTLGPKPIRPNKLLPRTLDRITTKPTHNTNKPIPTIQIRSRHHQRKIPPSRTHNPNKPISSLLLRQIHHQRKMERSRTNNKTKPTLLEPIPTIPTNPQK